MTAILVAPEKEKRAYRLRCGFTVPSGATGRPLELATLEAGKRFIRDMALRGYQWRSEYGYKREGPKLHREVMDLPSKTQQMRNPRENIVQTVGQSGDEDYTLVMTFVMPERYIQTREDIC